MAINKLVIQRASGYQVVAFSFETSKSVRHCSCSKAIPSASKHLVVKIAMGYQLAICTKCTNKLIHFMEAGIANAEKKKR